MVWDVAHAADQREALAAQPVPGSPGIAQAGSTHPFDASLVAGPPKVSAAGFRFFKITVTFSAAEGGSTLPPPDPDPLKHPPKFRWREGNTTEPCIYDAFRNLIRNAAGDLFDPPRQRPIADLFLTVLRNERTYDSARNLRYRNKVCSGPVDIFSAQGGTKVDKGQAKLLSYLPAGEYDQRSQYVPVAYDFELRADGFFDRVPNVGLNGWFESGGTRKPGRIYGPDKQPVDKPVPLALDGKPVDPAYTVQRAVPKAAPYQIPGNIKTERTPEGVYILIYQNFEEEDFGGVFG